MVKVLPHHRTKEIINSSPNSTNRNLHFICAYVNEDLRTLKNKELFPEIKINPRFCQIFSTKEELENLVYYGNNLPGIIVRQISAKPFYILEDGEIQRQYCGNLYYNFVYSFEDKNPDEWIDNPTLRKFRRENFITQIDYILNSSYYEKLVNEC